MEVSVEADLKDEGKESIMRVIISVLAIGMLSVLEPGSVTDEDVYCLLCWTGA